jgi:single-stranded DNA-binding protein
MMSQIISFNKMMMQGRVMFDPKLTYVGVQQTAMLTFTLSVRDSYAPNSSEQWITVLLFRAMAEEWATKLNRNDIVYAEGKFRIRRMMTKDERQVQIPEMIASHIQKHHFRPFKKSQEDAEDTSSPVGEVNDKDNDTEDNTSEES